MRKGAPSVNPAGRAARKGSTAPGSDGVITYGGFLPNVERSPLLTGWQKWTTYQNAMNEAIVALGIRYSGNLIAGTEWHCELNPSGDPKAEQGVDIVTRGLINADMPKPWNFVARKASMYHALGFSLHATAMRRMADGTIGYSEIEHRPQYTVWRWDKPSETLPLRGFWQRTLVSGAEYYVPLDEAFYCVDDTMTDSPEGSGLLRHVIELVRRLQRFQQLEAIAYEFDIGGLPIGYAPLAELRALAGTTDPAERQAYVDAATATMRNAIANRAKTPEKQQFLFLDSGTYQQPDGSYTSVEKYAMKVLRADFAGAPNIAAVIGRLQLEIARVFGVEFAMIGGGETSGSYAMHEDKTSMFATNLETILTGLGAFATNQLARRLIRANGLDPDTCTPRVVAEPISTESIEAVTRSLANIQLAMLDADDPARPVLRKRMRLPAELEKPAGAVPLPRPRPSQPSGGKAPELDAPTEPGANDPGATGTKPESALTGKRKRRAA